jgi:hypothetical protein
MNWVSRDLQKSAEDAHTASEESASDRDANSASADQRLTREQARKLILEPVLFPNKSSKPEPDHVALSAQESIHGVEKHSGLIHKCHVT